VTRRGGTLAALVALTAAAGAVEASRAAFTAQDTNTATFTTGDWVAPVVTLTTPAAGALTNDATPTLSGTAGNLTGDGTTITVRVYAGSTTAGTLVQTRSATRAGTSFTVDATTLAAGTYTAQASQPDAAGNTGTSAARTFTVDVTNPTGVSVHATNATGVAGRPDSGDVVTFTFSEAVTATSILAGWDGTARTVQARFTNSTTAPTLDTFRIRDSAGGTTVKLDANVATYANVVTATVNFAATMVRAADGMSVTVTFGAPSPAGSVAAGPSGLLNMRWTVTAGPLDLAGNTIITGNVMETDGDRDF
jgi:hypothetical protein